VAAYQEVAPLTLGELWAIPIMLRLALIENLRRVGARIAAGMLDRNRASTWAEAMVDAAQTDPKSLILVVADMARSDPSVAGPFVAELARRLRGQGTALALPLTWMEQRLAEAGSSIEQLVQSESQEQASDQVSVGNTIVCAPMKPILVDGFASLMASATLQSFFNDGVEVLMMT